MSKTPREVAWIISVEIYPTGGEWSALNPVSGVTLEADNIYDLLDKIKNQTRLWQGVSKIG